MKFITNILNSICIAFSNTKVGKDAMGNSYYCNKKTGKRFVVYKGCAEATKVPANWHSWLHYTINTPPANNQQQYSWQIAHTPNQTGTKFAYNPVNFSSSKSNCITHQWEPK
jgi:NADH:ubiquinone oxidoreductase subunit